MKIIYNNYNYNLFIIIYINTYIVNYKYIIIVSDNYVNKGY